MKNNRLASRLGKLFFQYLIRGLYTITVGLYLRLRFGLRMSPGSRTVIRGPCLLIANHSNSFDGLFIQCLIPRFIHFVVTDSVFNNRILAWLLDLAEYIPKRKFVNDMAAVHGIAKAVARGGIVGIFPEGRRNWDGRTGIILPAIYRLIRMLGVQVVAARISGSHLSEPRWADHRRYGRVEIELEDVISPQEAGSLDLDAIGSRINDAMRHNDFEWQREKHIEFKGHGLAEGFERLLFICPGCRGMGTIHSIRDRIVCGACGAEYRLDNYGFVGSIKGFLPADNSADLNIWQQEELARRLAVPGDPDAAVLSDAGASIFVAESLRRIMEPLAAGVLTLSRRSLSIAGNVFELAVVHGVSIYFKSGLDFRCGDKDYRILFDDKRVSVFKWQSVISCIKGQSKEDF